MKTASYIRPADVAEKFPLSVKRLEKLRGQGRGPRFYRRGRSIFYREEDVAKWIEAGAVLTND